MNKKWHTAKEKKLTEQFTNIFKAPSNASEVLWRANKDKSHSEIQFIHNKNHYTASAVKNDDITSNITPEDNNLLVSKHRTKLRNWEHDNIECTLCSSAEETDGTIYANAYWYDPYFRRQYSLSTQYKKEAAPDIISIIEDMSNYGPRKISNRMNNIFVVSGIIYLAAFLVSILVFNEINLSIAYVFFFGLLFLIGGAFNHSEVTGKNKLLSSLPFHLDFDKEIESYKKIGKICKRYKHGGEYFKNYNSWEEHISINFNYYTMARYRAEILFFLNGEYRLARDYIDTVKTMLFPGMITIVPAILNDALVGIFLSIFIILYSIKETSTTELRRDFIIDFTKVILPNETLE